MVKQTIKGKASVKQLEFAIMQATQKDITLPTEDPRPVAPEDNRFNDLYAKMGDIREAVLG